MAAHAWFNIRVYGIWIHAGQVWISEEKIGDMTIVKFPGGGLEWGEGTRDCLIREWKEELDIDIEVKEHFYTTDFFQPSAFDASQVISIYYFISVPAVPGVIKNVHTTERLIPIPLKSIKGDLFTFPIDRKVGDMLKCCSEAKSVDV